MQSFSSKIFQMKFYLRIVSVLFLLWAIFFKFLQMEGRAFVFLFIAGFIGISIIVVEFLMKRVKDWFQDLTSVQSIQEMKMLNNCDIHYKRWIIK